MATNPSPSAEAGSGKRQGEGSGSAHGRSNAGARSAKRPASTPVNRTHPNLHLISDHTVADQLQVASVAVVGRRSVGVEAAAGLAAEVAGGHHPTQRRHGGEVRVAELL